MGAILLSANPPGEATGTIKDWPSNTLPSGWLLCAGQAVSRSSYPALFSVIGTTYGVGDGSTSFNLPDLRGRVTAGKDDMGGTNAGRLDGGLEGGVGNSLQLGAVGGEKGHAITSGESAAIFWTPPLLYGEGSSAVAGYDGAYGSPHNNVQPTMILNKIIKT